MPNFIFWSSYYELNWKELEFLSFDLNKDYYNNCWSSDNLHFTLILEHLKNFLSFILIYIEVLVYCLFVVMLKLLFEINCFKSFLQVYIFIIPGNYILFRIVLWFIIFSFFIFSSISSGLINKNSENFGESFYLWLGLWGFV